MEERFCWVREGGRRRRRSLGGVVSGVCGGRGQGRLTGRRRRGRPLWFVLMGRLGLGSEVREANNGWIVRC